VGTTLTDFSKPQRLENRHNLARLQDGELAHS
jgi:hypothetical protein